MKDLFMNLFTLTGMIIFYLGVASTAAWHYFKHRWGRPDHRIDWTTLGFIVGVSALVFLGLQNTQLASEVKACQREFNTSLRARAAIYDENDRLSREHRHWLSKSDEAIGDLIRFTFAPPDPQIAALPRNDPRRAAWDAGLVSQYNLRTSRYHEEIVRIENQQDANQRDRAAHPLPDPTCGGQSP